MENIKGVRFGMFIIEKTSPDTFWGLATFGGSLFSGLIRSQKLVTLLSGGRFYGNFTVVEKILVSRFEGK